MKKLILLLFLIPVIAFSQTNYYIDPSQASDGTGTLLSPYNTWVGKITSSDANYFQLAGTTWRVTANVEIRDLENVVISRYGTGENPIIQIPVNRNYGFEIGARGETEITDSIVIKNFTFYKEGELNDPTPNATSIAGISILSYDGGRVSSVIVDSCLIYGHNYAGIHAYAYQDYPQFGLVDSYIDTIRVWNTTIHDCELDGILLMTHADDYIQFVEVKNTNIYNINLKWYYDQDQDNSSGDGIHLIYVDSTNIENCMIDHRQTSNKFGIIVSYPTDYVRIADCEIYSPKDTINPSGDGSAGAGIAIYNYPTNTVIVRNLVTSRGVQEWGGLGTTPGIYLFAQNLEMCYNVIDSTDYNSIWHSGGLVNSVNIYNNTFISGERDFNTNSPYLCYFPQSRGYFRNNIIITDDGENTLYNSYMTADHNFNQDINNASWDTLGFTDAANGDYSLTAAADSFIDLGTTTYTGHTIDIAGTTVPQNTLYDLGANEYFIDIATDPPDPVANIWVTDIKETQALIYWEPSVNATYYNDALAETCGTSPHTSTNIGNVTSVLIDTLTANTIYEFGIAAINTNGGSIDTYICFTTLCAVPDITSIHRDSETYSVGDTVKMYLNLTANVCNYDSLSAVTWEFQESNWDSTFYDATDKWSSWAVWNTSGYYDITATIISNGGSDSYVLNNLFIQGSVVAPVADFQANKTSVVIGESINFIDLSTNRPTSWLWEFGDDAVIPSGEDTKQYPSGISWSTTGLKKITLTATNSAGFDEEQKTDYITVSSEQTYQLIKW